MKSCGPAGPKKKFQTFPVWKISHTEAKKVTQSGMAERQKHNETLEMRKNTSMDNKSKKRQLQFLYMPLEGLKKKDKDWR